MIREDYDKIRQEINMGNSRIVGTVAHDDGRYYVIEDCARQSTDHALIGGQNLLDAYVDFFSLLKEAK